MVQSTETWSQGLGSNPALSLSFLICKMGMTTLAMSGGRCEDEMSQGASEQTQQEVLSLLLLLLLREGAGTKENEEDVGGRRTN